MLQADPCHIAALPGAAMSKAVQLLQATIDYTALSLALRPPATPAALPRRPDDRGPNGQGVNRGKFH